MPHGALSASSGSATLLKRCTSSSRLAKSPKLKGIIPTSALAGATRPSVCKQKRSKVCTKTTSSSRQKLISCLLPPGTPRPNRQSQPALLGHDVRSQLHRRRARRRAAQELRHAVSVTQLRRFRISCGTSTRERVIWALLAQRDSSRSAGQLPAIFPPLPGYELSRPLARLCSQRAFARYGLRDLASG